MPKFNPQFTPQFYRPIVARKASAPDLTKSESDANNEIVYYSESKHKDIDSFKKSDDFSRFKMEYISVLNSIYEYLTINSKTIKPPLGKEKISKAKKNFNILKDNLFSENKILEDGIKNIYSHTKKELVEFHDLIQKNKHIPLRKKIDAIINMSGDFSVCAGGLITSISLNTQKLRSSTQGIKGATRQTKLALADNKIVAFVREKYQNHSVAPNPEVYEVHYVNAYRNRLSAEFGFEFIEDAQIESIQQFITEEDVDKCRKIIDKTLKPFSFVAALASQYTDIIDTALQTAGVRSGPVSNTGEVITRALDAIELTQSTELDAEFGRIPPHTFMTEVPSKDGTPSFALAYSSAPLQGHFLHQLQAEKLISMEEVLVLRRDEDGRALECAGSLFWWKDKQGVCSAVLAHDLFEASPSEMVAQLKSQGLDPSGVAAVMDHMAELLLAEAVHPHTAPPPPQWLQAFAALTQKYSYAMPVHREHGLMLGLAYGCMVTLKRCLHNGVNLAATNAQGHNALMVAAQHPDRLEMLQTLLDYDALKVGTKPVHQLQKWAAESAALQTRRLQVQTTDPLAISPRHAALNAVRQDRRDVSKLDALMVDSGSPRVAGVPLRQIHQWDAQTVLHAQDPQGDTALSLAIKGGHTEVVRQLVEAGCDLTQCNGYDDEGLSALALASSLGRTQVAQVLLTAGADPNFQEGNGMTPLILASESNQADMVRLLLKQPKIDIDAVCDHGFTALMFASNKPDILQALLDAWASADLECHEGQTVAHYAAIDGCVETLKKLRDYSVRLDAPSQGEGPFKGYTPIMFATHHNKVSALEFLIDACKIDPEAHGDSTFSCTLLAAYQGHIEAMALLIDKGVDVNKANANTGDTPAIFAAVTGKSEMVEFLLEHGADLSVKNLNGATVFSALRDFKRPEDDGGAG
jgi:ankyrin repeat protein